MKNYYYFIIFFVPFSMFSQQIIIDKDKLNKTVITTGVLYDKVKFPNSKIEKFSSQNKQIIRNSSEWLNIYHELYQADYTKQLTHFLSVKKKAKKQLDKGIVELGIINYKYNKIKSEAWKNNKIRVANNKLIIDNPQVITTKEVFTVSPIVSKKNTGKTVTFSFKDAYYFSNKHESISFYLIDFDNQQAPLKVFPNQQISITFKTAGIKNIQVKAFTNNGTEYQTGFQYRVRLLAMPTPDETWNNYTANIAYAGSNAEGEVAVFFGAGNTDFTRPVIISDGFDPGNIRDLSEIYDITNQQNMVNQIRNEGYDLAILNFTEGDGYIQRNAMLLVKLIQDINARMTAAGTMKPANQIVIIGPSMSGLVSRYALDYMEQHNIPHNVRNWIAFDSPMKGANVPLGVQHWLRFFAEEADVSGAQVALESLKGPAAKQMLTYYYTETNRSAHTAASHPDYTSFYNEINTMGFPVQTRKVAISNGSGFGNGQAYNPGDKVVNYYYRSFWVDLDGDVWAVPNHTYNQIFEGLYDTAAWFDETHDDIYINNTDPLDSCPGGTRDTFQELDDTDTDGHGDIVAYYPAHAFIPTISAFAIQNTSNPYYNVNANINSLATPFDKLYYPNANEPHITITPTSVEWFKHEIINYPPVITSVPVTEIDEESPYSYQVTASDINEWNILNFTAVSLPTWLSFDVGTHTLSGVPQYADIGTHTISIKVDDGLDEAIHTFDIIVSSKCTHAPATVWNGSSWSNGIPDVAKHIIIQQDYNTANNGSINACRLTIENGKKLLVLENNPVVLERDLVNNGEITVENNGSFVQTSDKASISGNGSFKAKKTVQNLTHYYDMVFWASPLNSSTFQLNDVLSNAWRYYSYNPSTQYWVFEDGTANMQSGLGYVVSAPTGHTGGDINVLFQKNSDPFNTGVVQVSMTINGTGATDDDDWNLVGNPFPSAIDFDQFVADNSNIQGSYYLWTNCAGLDGNNHQPAGFSSYSSSGTTAACSNNGGTFTAGKYIASMQGFYVEANASGNVSFKNSQRVTNNNDNFASRNAVRNRLWLDLTDNNQGFSQILIDFNANATTGIDRLYDAKAIASSDATSFYSYSGQTPLTIQALPELTDQDQYIDLGYHYDNTASVMRIHLGNFEGSVTDKNIYLIDGELNINHNLKLSDYQFVTGNTNLSNRFKLLITNSTLSIKDYNNSVLAYQNDKTFIVKSFKEKPFNKVTLYDISGKIIYQSENLKTDYLEINIDFPPMLIFCKINFNDAVVIKKREIN